MKIVIVGCGIAGTAVATLLSRDGHHVTILEQAPQCKALGAGIMLQPSGQQVLNSIGVFDDLCAESAKLDGIEAFLLSGQPLIRLEYADLSDSPFAYGVHRGRLFSRLLNCCRENQIQIINAARVCQVRLGNQSVRVVDESGREFGPFDFVVAADGGRSTLRQAASIPTSELIYRYAALWTTGPCPPGVERLHQIIDGTQRLVGILPIGREECSFFWGLRTDDYEPTLKRGLDAWKSEVTQMCPLAASVLDCVSDFRQLTFGGYRHVRMRRWHEDRTVFLGDAAHPSSPHLGQGVNLALEDAAVFANSLSQTEDFHGACEQYTRLRWRKVRYYQQLTRMLSPFFQSDLPLAAVGRNLALPWFPRVPWIRRRMLRTLCGLQGGWF